MRILVKPKSRNAFWIALVAAPSLLLADGTKGIAQACGTSTPMPAPSAAPGDTMTVTTPGTGGSPGAFSGSATVTAPQAPTPTVDFNELTNNMNTVQSHIDTTRRQLDDPHLDPAQRLDLNQKLDGFLANKNALQYVVDAANAASTLPPAPAPPQKPQDRNITNEDLANLGNFLAPGKPTPQRQQKMQNALNTLDAVNDLKGLLGK